MDKNELDQFAINTFMATPLVREVMMDTIFTKDESKNEDLSDYVPVEPKKSNDN